MSKFNPALRTVRGFADDVADALGRHGLDARGLCIELTESALMGRERGTRTLEAIRGLGCYVGIDDFARQINAMPLLGRGQIGVIFADVGVGPRSADDLDVAALHTGRDRLIFQGLKHIGSQWEVLWCRDHDVVARDHRQVHRRVFDRLSEGQAQGGEGRVTRQVRRSGPHGNDAVVVPVQFELIVREPDYESHGVLPG